MEKGFHKVMLNDIKYIKTHVEAERKFKGLYLFI